MDLFGFLGPFLALLGPYCRPIGPWWLPRTISLDNPQKRAAASPNGGARDQDIVSNAVTRVFNKNLTECSYFFLFKQTM